MSRSGGIGRPACAGRRVQDMFYYVYILKSLKKNFYYVGMTGSIRRRVKQHNMGKAISTKGFVPFELIYKKKFESRAMARDYEKLL